MLKTIRAKLKFQSNYNKVEADSIELDTVLSYDLFIKKDDNYVIIVEAGTPIDSEIYAFLKDQETVYVSKNDSRKQGSDPKNLELSIANNKDNSDYSIKLLYEASARVWDNFFDSKDNYYNLKSVKSIAVSIIILIKNNKNFLKENVSNLRSDNMFSQHSIHVAIYAVSLANALNLNDKELIEVGITGLIYDSGLKKLDEEILLKSSALSDSEMEKIHRHPMYSVEFAKHNKIHNPYILDAILHHHENNDGSGYPSKLKAKDINIYTSILSICDVFDALTSDRPYRDHMSSYEALTHMMKDVNMKNKFNLGYVKLFISLLISK